MRPNTQSAQVSGGDEAWSEVEILVDETATLARMPMPRHEFHRELVTRLVQATHARSAAIWCRDASNQFSLEVRFDRSCRSASETKLLAARAQNVVEIARSRQAATLLPHQADAQLRNPTDDTLLLQPSFVDEQLVAVVETYHDESASPIEARNAREIAAVFVDLIAEGDRNRQLRELRRGDAAWLELGQFVDRVHRSLDLRRTAFAIANEGARVTGCDRVIVMHHQEGGCRTLSISGIDTFDQRSPQVRAAERLAKSVAAAAEPLWYSGEIHPMAAQIDQRLQAYLDVTPVRSLAVVPLEIDGADVKRAPTGVLMFERYESTPWRDDQQRRIESVCRHGATALRNANELSQLPLLGASRAVQWCLGLLAMRRLPKTVAIVCVAAVVIALLALVPADFEIRADGQLMPTHYRHIFAPADGVIQRLFVHHAESVGEGTPLLEMRRTELEYDEARLLGEILTNQKRLDAIRSALLNHKPGASSSASELHEMTSEEARLQILIASLRDQQAILERERAALTITSPIDGDVVTWGIEDALSLRPVHRGERLVSVANPSGPWQLELRIADHDIEHVQAAQRETKELEVRFILASHVGETYRGTVEQIAMATEVDEHNRPTVLVRVAVESEQLPNLRPGAGVIANVHCGRRPIGYVWFRELFDVVKTRLLF